MVIHGFAIFYFCRNGYPGFEVFFLFYWHGYPGFAFFFFFVGMVITVLKFFGFYWHGYPWFCYFFIFAGIVIPVLIFFLILGAWLFRFSFIFIFIFLGWCCECIYCSFGKGEWINRGFLTGPFCPIYGFGAIATLGMLQFLPNSTMAVFIGGVIITSTLEYITSWAMEKIFNTFWWDYSSRAFNINGRVCLLNSTLFGLLCLFLTFDIHPQIANFVGLFNIDFKYGFLFAFLIYFITDLCLAVKSALKINIQLKGLMELRNLILEKYDEFGSDLNFHELEEKLKSKNIKDELFSKFNDKQTEIGFFERRLIKSFPEMVNKKYPESLEKIKNDLNKKRQK